MLDEHGTIIAVNRAWREFAAANHARPETILEGVNYLEVCEAASENEAGQMAAGIRSVLSRSTPEFKTEYACHSPQEQRWFHARVTRFADDGPARVVMSLENITSRVRASAHMGRLIEDLLTYSRLGCRSISFCPVSPGEVIGDLTRQLQSRPAELSAQIRMPGAPPEMRGAVTLLTQIFLNPFDNALTYRDRSQGPESASPPSSGRSRCSAARCGSTRKSAQAPCFTCGSAWPRHATSRCRREPTCASPLRHSLPAPPDCCQVFLLPQSGRGLPAEILPLTVVGPRPRPRAHNPFP